MGPEYDQVQKITIIPRSNGAGGLTFFAPSEGRLNSGMYSRQYLESQLATALGGRLAEEIIFGEDNVTTGASNDIQQVARIAKMMIKQWGGKIMGNVELEVERVVNNAYLIAKRVLSNNRSLLDHLAQVLVEQEVVSAEEFQMMLVEFNVETTEFGVIGKDRNREKLPFQDLPTTV